MEFALASPIIYSVIGDILSAIGQFVLAMVIIYFISALLSSIRIITILVEIGGVIAYVILVYQLRERWDAGTLQDWFSSRDAFMAIAYPALCVTLMLYGATGEYFFQIFVNPNVWVCTAVEESWGILSDEGFTLHFSPQESGGFLSNVAFSFIGGFLFTYYVAVPYSVWWVWVLPVFFGVNAILHILFMIGVNLNILFYYLINVGATIAIIITSIVTSNNEGRRRYGGGQTYSYSDSTFSSPAYLNPVNYDDVLSRLKAAIPDFGQDIGFASEFKMTNGSNVLMVEDAENGRFAGYYRSEDGSYYLDYMGRYNGEDVESYIYDYEDGAYIQKFTSFILYRRYGADDYMYKFEIEEGMGTAFTADPDDDSILYLTDETRDYRLTMTFQVEECQASGSKVESLTFAEPLLLTVTSLEDDSVVCRGMTGDFTLGFPPDTYLPGGLSYLTSLSS